jgi:hypothetical protein
VLQKKFTVAILVAVEKISVIVHAHQNVLQYAHQNVDMIVI